MVDTPSNKRKSNLVFLVVLALVSAFMYVSILYKFSE